MKTKQLTEKKVAILATDGFEQDELLSPLSNPTNSNRLPFSRQADAIDSHVSKLVFMDFIHILRLTGFPFA
jgi:hypothetical protein